MGFIVTGDAIRLLTPMKVLHDCPSVGGHHLAKGAVDLVAMK